MVGIQLNSDELSSLAGLPSLHVHLYIMAIRQKMDFKTGIVGSKKGCYISWQYLLEMLYINPIKGIKTEQYSKQQLRRAANVLQKNGLIAIQSANKRLIFKCLLATLDKSVQIKADSCPTVLAAANNSTVTPIKSRLNPADKSQADIQVIKKADIHQYTVIKDIKKKDITNVISKKESPRVDSVFTHWQSTMNHPNAKLDAKRRSVIRKQLEAGYSPEDLKQAISGCALTPFYMGENDRGEVYDGLHLILRDADHVDKFIANFKNPPRRKETHAVNGGSPGVRKISSRAENMLRILQHTYTPPSQFAG